MQSFEQLAKTAYEAWHSSNPDAAHVRPVPFDTLPALNKDRWLAVAKAIAADLATVH
jgi:hypothetical protein